MRFGNKKARDVSDLAYGRNPALSFLGDGRVHRVWLRHNFRDQELLSLIRQRGLRPMYVSDHELNALTGGRPHQGIVLAVDPFIYAPLGDLIRESLKSKKPLLVILDGLSDPHNLGAIVRTAAAFAVDGLIIKEHRQVGVGATVAKVSSGAINHVRIARVPNLSNAILDLKKAGYWIYAADGEGETDYRTVLCDRPTALILGSEGSGVSPLIKKRSDFLIRIPLLGPVESLNVSVAAGIILARMRS